METNSIDLKGQIDRLREEIGRINAAIDGWNREVAEGRVDASAYSEEQARAARDKAANEVEIFELEARIRTLEENGAAED